MSRQTLFEKIYVGSFETRSGNVLVFVENDGRSWGVATEYRNGGRYFQPYATKQTASRGARSTVVRYRGVLTKPR